MSNCGSSGTSSIVPNPIPPTSTPTPISTTTISGKTLNILDNSAVKSTINYDGKDYSTDDNGNFSIPIIITSSQSNNKTIITSNSTITHSFYPEPVNQNIFLIPSDHNMDQFWALMKWVDYDDKSVKNENNTIRWTTPPHFVIFQKMEDGTDVSDNANNFVSCLDSIIGYNIPLLSEMTYELINDKPSSHPDWIVHNSETETGYFNTLGNISVNFSNKLPDSLGGIYYAKYSKTNGIFKSGGITIKDYPTEKTQTSKMLCFHETLHILGFNGHPNENTDNWEISVMNQKNLEGNYNDQSKTPSESDIQNLKILYIREPKMTPPDNNNLQTTTKAEELQIITHSDTIQ